MTPGLYVLPQLDISAGHQSCPINVRIDIPTGTPVTPHTFQPLIRQHAGLAVSLPWKGCLCSAVQDHLRLFVDMLQISNVCLLQRFGVLDISIQRSYQNRMGGLMFDLEKYVKFHESWARLAGAR